MNLFRLRNLLCAVVLGLFVIGCRTANIHLVFPTQTPDIPCADIEISKPMTESQFEYIGSHAYNLFYVNDEKSFKNVYSLNRADTVCSQYYGSTSGNFDVWKVVSGFIVGLEQPDKDLYHRGGEVTEGARFVNIYAKARFISQAGKEHDYWLQLTGNPPGYWFQLVQWDKPISASKAQLGLTAMDILATGKNSNGTNSYIDANTMIPNRLLRVNDQFVAVVSVGYTNSDEGFIASDTMQQFVNALEGEASFPIVPEGFFLRVQAMIVPSRP